jgi:hypothetical protein
LQPRSQRGSQPGASRLTSPSPARARPHGPAPHSRERGNQRITANDGPSTSGRSSEGYVPRGTPFEKPRRGRGRPPAPPAPAPTLDLAYDKPIPALLQKAEADVLPGGVPNTAWRRVAYQLRLAASVDELLSLYREHRHKVHVWGNHHTALTAARLAALLYPQVRALPGVPRL